jgi:putative drug exporter of the RND superfamily
VIVGLWALAGSTGGTFTHSASLPGTESQAVAERLEAAGFDLRGEQGGTVVVHAPGGVLDEEIREPATAMLQQVADLEGVSVQDPFTGFEGRLISEDGTIAVAPVDFQHADLDEAVAAGAQIVSLRAETSLPDDARIELGGTLLTEEPDFASTGFGLIAAAVILFVAFGSLLAMALPLVTAVLATAAGMALVFLASRWVDIPPFAPAALVMIALGAGINYALFIVTRYREELRDGHPADVACGRAMATAGTSAFLAGATVVTSLLALLFVGIDDVRSLAIAIMAGVIFVMIGSVTVLPALLGFVGDRIDRFGPARRRAERVEPFENSIWYRWARRVQRAPLTVLTASVVVLVVLALPVTDLRLGFADATTEPEASTSRQAHELIAEGFGVGFNGPVILAVAWRGGDAGAEQLDAVRDALEARPDVDRVLPPVPSQVADVALLQVVPTTGPQDPATSALVRDLRERAAVGELTDGSLDVLVGGVVAAGIDFADLNARALPWFIGSVLLLSFLLLALIFRSILVPFKAVVVNLLSVGAAYGVLVAVFQWGWFGSVLGQGGPGPIEPWVPMMLFAITFGLSIDYEVFLLSRVRERFVQTGDNATAVAYGLARSARPIFASAAIMFCVFAGFALLASRELQMLGLGLAVAIAVDATFVRLLLVPATMELLGDRNWWQPRWMRRVLPDGGSSRTARRTSRTTPPIVRERAS